MAALDPMAPAERARVLVEWNDTARRYPAGELAHGLFAAQAERTPDAAALVFRGEAVSYAELERRANRLAHALRRRGAGPEARVGVLLERTPEMVAALLAVLKAGGAYVPLDPAHPRERLARMIEDAGVRLVVAGPGLADRVPEGAAELLPAGAGEGEPDTAPESGAGPENLSHVIFTSGSTGRPKGVMIRHASVAVLLHWLRETVSDEERARVLGSTSISFDVSVAEIFGTQLHAPTVVVAVGRHAVRVLRERAVLEVLLGVVELGGADAFQAVDAVVRNVGELVALREVVRGLLVPPRSTAGRRWATRRGGRSPGLLDRGS